MSFTADDFASGASIWEAEFDSPLPGNQAGSWIPTPPAFVFPNAPAKDPFDTPAGEGGDVDPGFGMGQSMAVFSPESVAAAELDRQTAPMGLMGDDEAANMENTYGSLGAEAWYTQLAKTAATIAAGYAEKAGYIPDTAKAALVKAGLLPVEAAEEPVLTIETEPPPPPPRPKWVLPVVIGGGALLLFMAMGRRR